MSGMSRRLVFSGKPLVVAARPLSCSAISRVWWTPQAITPLTDVPVRMKGKAKKSHVPKVDESILEGHVNVEALKKSMQTAVDALEWQFNRSITVRPTVALLDYVNLVVDGKKKRIKDVAVLTQQKDGFVINCTQQPEMMNSIQEAIESSGLELDAIATGKNTLRVPVPKVTGELRQKLCRMAKEAGHKAKFGIQRVRGNGINDCKRLSGMSFDDIKSFEKQIDLISKLYIERTESLVKTKEKELLG